MDRLVRSLGRASTITGGAAGSDERLDLQECQLRGYIEDFLARSSVSGAQVGERLRVRFIGPNSFVHPMHIHGGPFEIVETDGNPVQESARLLKDTVNAPQGALRCRVVGAPAGQVGSCSAISRTTL